MQSLGKEKKTFCDFIVMIKYNRMILCFLNIVKKIYFNNKKIIKGYKYVYNSKQDNIRFENLTLLKRKENRIQLKTY